MQQVVNNKIRPLVVVAAFVICLIFTFSQGAQAFNKSFAVNYADTYWQNYSPYYRSFTADCTNFVSQIMRSGGLANTGGWYYNNTISYSRTWTVADDLKEYIKNNVGYKIGSWSKYGTPQPYHTYAYVDNSNNLYGGDEVIFYTWDKGGTMDHASFCVRNGKCQYSLPNRYGDLINQHVTDRQNCIWHLDTVNNHSETTYVYAFRLY